VGVLFLKEMNNRSIACGLESREIKIWNINAQMCIATLEEHSSCVPSLIQLKNGNIVSSSWNKTIKIWDLKTNQCIDTLKGPNYCWLPIYLN
jgi:WD40 repeat protein